MAETLDWKPGLGSGGAWAAWSLAIFAWENYGLEFGTGPGEPVDLHADIDADNFAYRILLDGQKALEIRVRVQWDINPAGERWVDRSKCVDFSFRMVEVDRG